MSFNDESEVAGQNNTTYTPPKPINVYYPLTPEPIPAGRMTHEQVEALCKEKGWY